MDLCTTNDRYRTSPNELSLPYGSDGATTQNGLFFWPWAAAAAANSYYGVGSGATGGNSTFSANPTQFELEQLYKFSYPSYAAASGMSFFPDGFISGSQITGGDNFSIDNHSNIGNQGPPSSEYPLKASPNALQESLPPSLHPSGPQQNDSHLSTTTPPLLLGTQNGKLSPSMLNHKSVYPVAPHHHHHHHKSSASASSASLFNHSRNKFLSPISQYHKYSSYSRPYFNYHSSSSNHHHNHNHHSHNHHHSQNHNTAIDHTNSTNNVDGGPPPTKGYKCKMCQQLCFSKHDLARHNSGAHKQDPRPYRCEHCGRQFSTGAYLGQHRRIHLGIKPYICRFCERRFTQLSHVQQHERIHTGEKPYRCLACGKSFTQMSNLQSHQRQHMKGKPYRCEHCFMCFDIQEELDTHVQAKHAGHKYSKILVCPICGKNYNSETYLNKHILKHKESAAAANMSVMAAAVNAVAAAAAHLPRHNSVSVGTAMVPSGVPNLHDHSTSADPQLISDFYHNSAAVASAVTSNYNIHSQHASSVASHSSPSAPPNNNTTNINQYSSYPPPQHQPSHQQHNPHHHHNYPSNNNNNNSYNNNQDQQHHLSQHTAQQHPYFGNSAAFINPEFMSTMTRDIPYFYNNNIFSDTFESHFSDNNSVSALCMKKEDESAKTFTDSESQSNNNHTANQQQHHQQPTNCSNDDEEDDANNSVKSRSPPINKSSTINNHSNPSTTNHVDSAILNSSNIPVINFDTSAIDEMANKELSQLNNNQPMKFGSKGAFTRTAFNQASSNSSPSPNNTELHKSNDDNQSATGAVSQPNIPRPNNKSTSATSSPTSPGPMNNIPYNNPPFSDKHNNLHANDNNNTYLHATKNGGDVNNNNPSSTHFPLPPSSSSALSNVTTLPPSSTSNNELNYNFIQPFVFPNFRL